MTPRRCTRELSLPSMAPIFSHKWRICFTHMASAIQTAIKKGIRYARRLKMSSITTKPSVEQHVIPKRANSAKRPKGATCSPCVMVESSAAIAGGGGAYVVAANGAGGEKDIGCGGSVVSGTRLAVFWVCLPQELQKLSDASYGVPQFTQNLILRLTPR